MLKKERKEYLKDIILTIDNALTDLDELEESVDQVNNKIDEVQELIDYLPFDVEVDLDEIKDSINESAGIQLMENVYEQARDYWDRLEEYLEELPPSRAEKLRDNYFWYEDELLYLLQYETGQFIDDVRGALNDAKDMIKNNLANC